ncbi:chemotaxis protein CheA [Chelatococcus sp. SYSU_G07232]|uniref:Chemotaxis protein CheA n=1 Tax=Chelatococcus albus TaxID=3047466 RepID=A0ABT7AGB1_9HYPH|nr:chemotaxis protein CheA [Chelatococcus sp. SYSU_G07232]MDJ1158047.1 chemotaxis protein CheA [Chelatococcus sp. SYSU_G07232]
MDFLDELKQSFFQECEELLAALEARLQALDEGSTDPEDVNAAFRAIHSVKGGAGAFGFADLVNFAHAFEASLDHLRTGRVPVQEAPTGLFLRCSDAVADLVAAARNGEPANKRADLIAELERVGQVLETPAKTEQKAPELTAIFDKLIAQVASGTVPGAAPEPVSAPAEETPWNPDDDPFENPRPAPAVAPPAASAAARPAQGTVVRIRPHRDLFRRGIDPRVLLRSLEAIGPLTITADVAAVPSLQELDVGDCCLQFDVAFEGAVPREAIANALDMFLDAQEFSVGGPEGGMAPSGAAPVGAAAPGGAPEVPASLAASLAAIAASAEASMATRNDAEGAAAPAAAGMPARAANDAGQPQRGGAPAGRAKQVGSIRVDLDRIDRLMNLVGEIVITQSMLAERARMLTIDEGTKLADGILTLTRQTRELQDHVMAVRAQPVKTVFQRMPRLVRELAQTLGKEARLVLSGENTEVDKTVIEELADPLTHMIRNSMDHGLETAAERTANGKPAEGVIHLSAEHRAGRIVISVADDGRGINREKLLAKARSKGLVAPDARPSPQEIDEIIFAPGLSTADKVTDVSGRGVGMDVVRRNVEALGGRITVDSDPGRGCRFTMSLPLTLAVLDGMIVRSAGERFVVPITSIVETLRLSDDTVEHLPSGQEVLRWRNDVVPVARLGAIMTDSPPSDETVIIIAETDRGDRIGIAVDDILGQQQVVVKSLETNYGRVTGASAATILGDGLVALILDVDTMPRLAAQQRRPLVEAMTVNKR